MQPARTLLVICVLFGLVLCAVQDGSASGELASSPPAATQAYIRPPLLPVCKFMDNLRRIDVDRLRDMTQKASFYQRLANNYHRYATQMNKVKGHEPGMHCGEFDFKPCLLL